MGRRAALHIVAKSSIARLAGWAHERGWDHLSLVSTAGNHFDIQAAAEALRNYPSPETIEGLFEVSKARGLDGWARGDDAICRLGARGFKIEHGLEARRVIADSAAPKRISAT